MAEEPDKLDISDEMIAERRGGLGKMPDDMPFWMAKSITSIDSCLLYTSPSPRD